MERLDDAIDQSSYVIQCDFVDDTDEPTLPIAPTWTLTDGSGEIVNGREDVPISSPSSTVHVALSGADLDVDEDGGNTENMRCLVVSATYNSTLTGTQLPVKKAVKFLVTDLPQV